MKRCLFVLLLSWSLPALAEWGKRFDFDFDQDKKPWREVQAQLPAYPDDADLLPFYVGPTTSHQYFIDARSVSVGDDGVVRYTLVVRTAGGALNVTYEGLRCNATEHRVYAFGHAADKSWSKARANEWRPLPRGIHRPQAVLNFDYFCPNFTPARDAAAAVELLRSKPR